ncbi:uncharacterized protein LOC124640004 [Helicoverpa zea]|uniref:uncharacterized protein LOC124640004 n=1 Tax=Helicoverpa zea TaxID=7113 RepID=UPI001F577CC4|nr:uncharacterized protein LOC124640004 [Helicoverpa zea]
MSQGVEADSSLPTWNILGDSFPKQYDTIEETDKKSKPENISKIKLKLQDIQDAHNRIKNDVVFTPIIEAKHIGRTFCNVFLKCENLQNTGSFKARGACNVLYSMSPSDKSKGCTVSGGRNYLFAMTYYGFRQSVPINVIVPKDCPLVDKHRYKENFAIVKVHGNDHNDASLHALTYCDEIGSNYVHGSDRLDLIAGYGTLGLELLTQMDKMDAILCPVGSGGLVASLVLAVKSLKPNCLIYGVECAAAPTMTRALQEKKPVMIQQNPTIADSLCSVIASNNAFNIIRGYLDRMITVDEVWISRAMINILEREKMVVEGAAACPVAAVMAGKVPELRGKNVVCVLSGGNINSSRMSRVIDRGMAAEGRLVKFSVALPDVPGAMAKLLARVTDTGADVKSFVPERAWMRRDIFTVSNNRPLKDDRPHILSFAEIKQAAERIEGGIIHTPLCEAKISKYMDYNIYLKCENLQYTGSCAERGVRNALLAYGAEGTERGVMVPSNGNMALAAAYHGGTLGLPVTVVMPERTPPALAQRCSELGANVLLCGETLDDVMAYTKKVHRDNRQILLNSDDPLVMAGLGTLGVEIITQLPEADAVIVPVASGGLLASVLVACKKLKCSCLVYGAECSKVPKMMKALQAGQPVTVTPVPNLADGLNASTVGMNAFATLKGRLDRMLVVDELYIARALISMLERERLVADGAGVCAIAAVMQGLVPELRGKRAVCIVSGGNIDSGRLSRTIQRGLGSSGRLMRFAVPILDHRGGLEQLAKTISEESAVLKSLVTEQVWVHSDVGTTWANVVVETSNEEHASGLKDRLRDLYPTARFAVIDLDDKHKVFVR